MITSDSSQAEGLGAASSTEFAATWRTTRPWGILILPVIVVLLALASLPHGGPLNYPVALAIPLVLMVLGAYSYRNLGKRIPGVVAVQETELVVRPNATATTASGRRTYLVYGVLAVLIGVPLLGSSGPDIILSLVWSASFLFLVVYVSYSVRRSAKPGELRFAKFDTVYKLLGQEGVRIKTRVKIPKIGYSKLSFDLVFDNAADRDQFCQELTPMTSVGGASPTLR